MLVSTNQLLLINTTMNLPISPRKPSKSVRLPNAPQPLHHLMIIHLLGPHKIIQHLALVNESQDRSNGIRLPRQKGMATAPVDQGSNQAKVSEDSDRDTERQPEGVEGFFARIDPAGRWSWLSWLLG